MTDQAVCQKCGGEGVVRTEDGGFARCSCKIRATLRELYRPILRLFRESVKVVPEGRLERRNQAIVRSDQNLACLINYVVTAWGTTPNYDFRAIEELNSIAVKGTAEYRTLSDYIRAFDRFVIDWSVENPLRGKGWQEKDEMVLLEVAKIIGAKADKELFVIIGPTAKAFKASHKIMCDVLADMGVPYFDREKYWRFAERKTMAALGVTAERETDYVAD